MSLAEQMAADVGAGQQPKQSGSLSAQMALDVQAAPGVAPTYKNQPFAGAIGGVPNPVAASVPAGSVEQAPPAAWRQFLERQATHPEQGGLLEPLVRGPMEAVASSALNAPGGIMSQAGRFVSGLGSPEQFDSPTLQNVGSVLSRIGAAITPGHWAQPTTAICGTPAAG